MDYYNEIDPYAAQWLRNLIDAGHIAPGWVDTRSIEDVKPNELTEFRRCHFFAGIGGWALALEIAGWPSDRRVWTGSCPCQPFSAAGKGDGFADERHLWPAWQHLIAQCNPPVIFGEQVASKAVDAWIDLVHADMEGLGYSFGSVPFPAAGIGAPHIRDRNYWVAHANGGARGQGGPHFRGRATGSDAESRPGLSGGIVLSRLADAEQYGSGRETSSSRHGKQAADRSADQHSGYCVSLLWLGDANDAGLEVGRCGPDQQSREERRETAERSTGLSSFQGGTGPTNGQWGNADWLACRDGKWRCVEPGTFPLAHGVSGRVGRLRAYGNAIVPAQAAEFIGAYLDTY